MFNQHEQNFNPPVAEQPQPVLEQVVSDFLEYCNDIELTTDPSPAPYITMNHSNSTKKEYTAFDLVATPPILERKFDCCALLNPKADLQHDAVWICHCSVLTDNEGQKFYKTLEYANKFLSLGYRVLLVFGNLKPALETFCDKYLLRFYDTHLNKTEKKYSGYAVDLYIDIALIPDTLIDTYTCIKNANDLESHLLYEKEHRDLKVVNHYWNDLRERNNRPIIELPIQSTGELGAFVNEVSDNSQLSKGFVLTKILAVIACTLRNFIVYHSDKSSTPLITYSLIAGETGIGKDRLTDFLYQPINSREKSEKNSYKEFKKANKKFFDDDNPTSLPFKEAVYETHLSSIGSLKGVLLYLHKSTKNSGENQIPQHLTSMVKPKFIGTTIQNTEASMFFSTLGDKNEMQQNIGVLNSTYVGVPTKYLTKDITVSFEKLNLALDLMVQPNQFDDLLKDSNLWTNGLWGRFLLYKEPPIDYNNITITKYNQDTDLYKDFQKRIEYLYSASGRIQLVTGQKVDELLAMYSLQYKKRKGNQHQDYEIYNRPNISEYINRARDHILRIAFFISLYEYAKNKEAYKNDYDQEHWVNILGEEEVPPLLPIQKEVTISENDVHRGAQIYEYYVQHLIYEILKNNDIDERYEKLLDKMYQIHAKGNQIVIGDLHRSKVIRQANDCTKSVNTRELWEVLENLQTLGYVKIIGTGKERIIKLNPSYIPSSKS